MAIITALAMRRFTKGQKIRHDMIGPLEKPYVLSIAKAAGVLSRAAAVKGK